MQLRTDIKKYIPYIILAIIVVGCKSADNLFYLTDDWKEYKTYNVIRANINDNPNAFNLKNEELPNYVSEVDYALMLYFIQDPNTMTLSTIKDIQQKIQNRSLAQKIINIKLLSRYRLILISLLLTIAVAFMQEDKISTISVISYFIFLLILLCAISLDRFPKLHVIHCVVIAVFVVASQVDYNKRLKFGLTLFSCSWLLISVHFIKQIYEEHKADVTWHQELYSKYAYPLMEVVPEKSRLLLWADNMLLNYQSPFRLRSFPCKFYFQGWFTYSPLNKTISKSHLDLVESNFLFLLNKPKDDSREDVLMQLLQNHLKLQYNCKTELNIVNQNQKFKLVKLTKLNR